MFLYWNPPSRTKCSNQLSTLARFNFFSPERKFGELQRVSQVALVVKNGLLMQETWVRFLGGEDPLEEGTATHSSILAWRIPWTEEPGGLQTTGSQRVGHNWSDLAHTQRFAQWYHLVRRFSTERDPVGDCITWASDPQPVDSAYGLALHLLADAWNFLTWDKTSHSPV